MKKKKDLFSLILSDFCIQVIAIFAFLFVMLSMLPKEENDSALMGKVCAELTWDNNRDVDLDLWGKVNDSPPIGYSNMHGDQLDLFRDVLGKSNNNGDNLEIMCSSKLFPGHWTFNVHYFSNHESNPPDIDATVKVRIFSGAGAKKRILTGTYHFTKEGQEKTFFNFELDDKGDLIDSSINSYDNPIRTGNKVGGIQ